MTENNSNSADAAAVLTEETITADGVTVRVVTFPAGQSADGKLLGAIVTTVTGQQISSPPHMILDLRHVDQIQGPFFGELLKLMKQLRSQGGSLRLCHLRQPIHDVLRVTRMEKLFECFADRETALASIAAAKPSG